MNTDWLILFQLSTCFLVLFGIAELLHVFLKVQAEHTRKLVHAGTGLLTLLFPVYFQYLWQVIVICSGFLLLLVLSKKYHFLASINGISRKSSGSFLYPVIVIIVFAFYLHVQTSPAPFGYLLYFYLPVLLMAICDPLAAIVGSMYKQKYPGTQGKTRAGSLTFFVAAFVISLILFTVFDKGVIGSTWLCIYAVILAGGTMLTERLSGGGWDNFTIPLTALIFLYLIDHSLA